jgi:Ran GTPase-activating protein (RanGAP) involved in mRNA processing and transport/O-acetyl-ADP-ribose deacetylase (regulator of RNase III)
MAAGDEVYDQMAAADMGMLGEEFENYCKKNGLCNLCGQTKTHKREFKLVKKNQWKPLTVPSKSDGGYIVYKGYCVQPGCFTLEQAKRLLGEVGPGGADGDSVSDTASISSNSTLKKMGVTSRLLKKKKKKGSSKKTGQNDFDGLTGFTTSVKKGPKSTGSTGSRQGSSRSVSSRISRDDDDRSVGSALTSNSKVRMSLQHLLKEHSGTLLDLSSTKLHHVHITELVNSLSFAATLNTLILENCKLNDNEIEVLGNGLARDDTTAPIERFSLRSNRLGNRGTVSLAAWFQKSKTLQELDLSKNQIGSRGATATLHAFRDNPDCKIRMLNFAHNEIWDPDDGSFFSANTSLQLLNLEGNFIHDEGVEAVAKGLIRNSRTTNLKHLFLGWNGIGDEGAIQLARMFSRNTSLETLGLGENDITSVGARAMLACLASNSTLREITGLYHNQIDRKFVIAAIKRLLQSHVAIITEDSKEDQRMQAAVEASMSAMDTLAEPIGEKLPSPDEVSESSLDWAEKLYNEGGLSNDAVPPILEITTGADSNGKMDEVEDLDMEVLVKEEVAPAVDVTSEMQGMSFNELEAPKSMFDRLMVFEAAPLAYFSQDASLHHAHPLHEFGHEVNILKHVAKDAGKIDAELEIEAAPATLENLKDFIEQGTSRVLHLSCHGHPDQLAFENGAGYILTMTQEELKNLIQSAKIPIKLVVVNSYHSGRIGKAFLEAGVPHVVCCHHSEVFRDRAAAGFLKNLYRGLATNKSLKQAFLMAQEAIRVEEITKHVERYVLLPRKPEDESYHDVPIFYTHPVPEYGIADPEYEDDSYHLPPLPRHFMGREVDMYEILEALRADDVARLGGGRGSGKTAVAAAVCRYINFRKKTFKYDNVFWMPPPDHVKPEEDTLFGDLCGLFAKILTADHNVWEDGDVIECRERINIELEGTKSLFAIDTRKFETDTSAQNLEDFLGDLLNSGNDLKFILITPSDDLPPEEDTIYLKNLDFKATSLLFGEVSRFITPNGCPAAQSSDEFGALMVPPSVAKLQDQNKFSSSRRSDLMGHMGGGNPKRIIKAAKQMPASTFIQLIGMANTPEIHVDSSNTLDTAIKRWTAEKERAVGAKNHLRALDLERVLKELETMRKKFPTLDDLIKQEEALQRKLESAMSSRQYKEGNAIKREILSLKKLIMQEKRAAPNENEQAATDRLADLQKQMRKIMQLANNSFSSLDHISADERVTASFNMGSAYHNCALSVSAQNALEYDPGDDMGAIICWTNECCDVNLNEGSRALMESGGPNLQRDISSLPGITRTPWGLGKCGTGNAVIVGPGNYDDLLFHCIILAVGPTSKDVDYKPGDEDALHYIKIMLRSCIRSCLILAKHSQVHSIAFPTLTTKVGGATYDHTLLMFFKILVEEARHSDLNRLHISAVTEEEASKLIAMGIDMGLDLAPS